jgi:integrase
MAYSKRRSKGAGTIYKRGKYFYLEYTINGQKSKVSLKTTNRKEAEVKAKDLLPVLQASTKEQIAVHVAEAKKLRRQSGLLIEKIWQEYLKQPNRPDSGVNTLRGYERVINKFVKWLRSMHPEINRAIQIDTAIAGEYCNELWNGGISARTYNAYLQPLKLIFGIILDSAALDINPFGKISKKIEEQESRKEFSREQVILIFEAFEDNQLHLLYKEQMMVMFNICCWTGSRGQDACLLRWESVNFDSNTISYIPEKTRRKTNRGVSIPIHPQLKEALLMALEWQKNEYVIPDVAERYKSNPSGVSKDSIKVFQFIGLKTATDKVNSRRKFKASIYSMHSFRHTFVSFCANSGVPIAVVQSIVGHGSPAMTKHYTHISREATEKAVASLPQIGDRDKLYSKRELIKNIIDNLSENELEKVLNMLQGNKGMIASAVDE